MRAIARSNASFAVFLRIRGEVGEAEDGLRPIQIRREFDRRLRRFDGALAIAERQPQLGQARPGERVLRPVRDRLHQQVARRLESERRLFGIGQGDQRRHRPRAQLDRPPALGMRVSVSFWATAITALSA